MDWTQLDSFCAAPWVHSHVDAVGLRRLCCIAKSAPAELSSISHAEFANSEYMRSIRKQMISGVLPEDCANCAIPLKKEIYRLYFNNRFRHHFDDIRRKTKHDGSTSGPIVSLDYRAHTCNLKCRTCGPWNSSAWLTSGELRAVYRSDFPEIEESIHRSPYKREFLEMVNNNRIEEIYFSGGEPLASPEHHRVLDYLIESNRCSGIHLSYNTNLSLNGSSIERWISRLRHFESVYIGCSIDGSHEVSEYIRAGLHFDKFESNLKMLIAARSECPQFMIALDPTLTSLFLLDLKNFCQFALSYYLPVTAKLMAGNEIVAAYLRCEFLPKVIRLRLIDEWRQYYSSLPDDSQALLSSLKDNLQLVESLESFSLNQMQSAAKQSIVADYAFQSTVQFEHFLQRDQEVYLWWKSITEHGRPETPGINSEGFLDRKGNTSRSFFNRMAAFFAKPVVRRVPRPRLHHPDTDR